MNSAVVSVGGLRKSYHETLFSEISFSLGRGEGLGVSGANGSGKSTLLDILAGLTNPDAGIVHIAGQVGYAPQKDGLSDKMSCLDNLRFFAALIGLDAKMAAERVRECVEICGLSDFLKKRLNKCSAGMRQRVSLAVALLNKPSLLLLDEAFSPLDTTSRDALMQTIYRLKHEGTALILVSHNDADFYSLCERCITLPSGNLRELTL